MKIGSIGATLARKLAASGRGIKLANSNRPDTIRDLREIATLLERDETWYERRLPMVEGRIPGCAKTGRSPRQELSAADAKRGDLNSA